MTWGIMECLGFFITPAARLPGCSHGVSRALIEYFRLSPGRVETVTNPVDIEEIERLARFNPDIVVGIVARAGNR